MWQIWQVIGIFRVVLVHIPIVQPPVVKWASTLEPTAVHKYHNIYQHNDISMSLNLERELSPEGDTWHNWHKPEKASGTEVAAAAWWQGQQHSSLYSWNQWWQQIHIMLIQWWCYPQGVRTIVTVIAVVNVLVNTTVRNGVAVVTANLKHNEKITKKKNRKMNAAISQYNENCLQLNRHYLWRKERDSQYPALRRFQWPYANIGMPLWSYIWCNDCHQP